VVPYKDKRFFDQLQKNSNIFVVNAENLIIVWVCKEQHGICRKDRCLKNGLLIEINE
jgi:hypothetical protein